MDLFGIVPDGVYIVISGAAYSVSTLAIILIALFVLWIVLAIGYSMGSTKGFNSGFESGMNWSARNAKR
jgi:hypothetical protein